MRKFIAIVLVEAALICAAISLTLLTTIAPVWIWPTAAVAFLVFAALIYTAEIKRRFFTKGPQTATPATDPQLSKHLEIKLDRILDYLHKEFGLRLKGSTKFNALEATVSVGKGKAIKPTFRLTLRRLLGILFP